MIARDTLRQASSARPALPFVLQLLGALARGHVAVQQLLLTPELMESELDFEWVNLPSVRTSCCCPPLPRCYDEISVWFFLVLCLLLFLCCS